ncbi:MAG: hypothetical protein EA377_08390 [Phycisphaerales bacterium]|nr:MAG: hypothetical protein EA377_08390 [Phycisphaerales bacterium]
MNRERLNSILGHPTESAAHELLGLAEMPKDPREVNRRLDARLAHIEAHPDSGSREAEIARRIVRVAAQRLHEQLTHKKIPDPTRRTPQRFSLTEFDRSVLGVLVGSGGWNAASRARLVALANYHGVGPYGLMRVICGLNDHARRHGPRITISDITGRAETAATIRQREVEEVRTNELINRYAPEFREGTTWATVKLSILFGLLTLLIASAIIVPLWHHQRTIMTTRATPPPTATAPDPDADRDWDRDSSEHERTRSREPAMERWPTVTPPIRAPRWDEVDRRAAELRDEFSALTGRMLTSTEPDDEVFEQWTVAVDRFSRVWLALDDRELGRVEDDFLQPLYASAGRAERHDRLLDALGPVSREPAAASELISGSWRVGMLFELTQDHRLPQRTRHRALNLLNQSFASPIDQEAAWRDREAAIGDWLERVLSSMARDVDTIRSDELAGLWGAWIETLGRVRFGESRQRQLLDAVESLLREVSDPREPASRPAIVAHLLRELDFETSATVRQRVGDWFRPGRLSSRQLWVLTSLLALDRTTPWLDEQMIIMPEADDRLRGRAAQDLEAHWPRRTVSADDLERGHRIAVDVESGQRWRDLEELLLNRRREISDPLSALRQLTRRVWLNEAALHLAVGDRGQAREVMNAIESMDGRSREDNRHGLTNPRGRGGSGSIRPGQPVGPDGVWAEAYVSAGRNVDARLQQINQLDRRGGGDLGRRDAAVLVREAYRGSPREVSDRAQRLVESRFASGPVVILELLDQLPDAPRHSRTISFIERITNATIDDQGDDREQAEARARLALIERLLKLQQRGEDARDEYAELVRESFERQLLAIRPEERSVSDEPVLETAQRLRQVWWSVVNEAAASADNREESLAKLDNIQQEHALRSRLARGSMQKTLAERIGELDLLAELITLEQPPREATVQRLLERTLIDRREATDVLEQLLITEAALSRLWRMRLDLPERATGEGSS